MQRSDDRTATIEKICGALAAGELTAARQLARDEYPWAPRERPARRFSRQMATRIFLRDGFIDRYFGNRLIFPGALLLLSRLLPEEFPYHSNWKLSKSHIVYWELWPALDHVEPVARGGASDESNLVSTSSLHNSAKSHWTLEELGWRLLPPGDFRAWDGLMYWFLEICERNPRHLAGKNIKEWHRAAQKALES